MFIKPVAFLWFIYVLFFVSVFIRLLEKIFKDNPYIITCILVPMTLIYTFYKSGNSLVDRFLYYPLFYYIGVLFFRKKELLKNRLLMIICAIVFVAIFIPYCKYNRSYYILKIVTNLTGAVALFISLHLIFKKASEKNILSVTGRNSLFIYILHPIILNAIRMMFMLIKFENVWIWTIVLILSGILLPMIYAYIADKVWLFDIPFRPRRYILKSRDRNKGK